MKSGVGLLAAGLMISLGQVSAGETDEKPPMEISAGEAAARVAMARDVLSEIRQFSSSEIGESGRPSPGSIALTTVVNYNPKAKEFFEMLYMFGDTPASRLYGVAGMLILDPNAKKRFDHDHIKAHSNEEVEVEIGCIVGRSTFDAIAGDLLKGGGTEYLLKELQ